MTQKKIRGRQRGGCIDRKHTMFQITSQAADTIKLSRTLNIPARTHNTFIQLWKNEYLNTLNDIQPDASTRRTDKALMKRVRTGDVEIRDWSWRAVRSEEDTLAGAPLWSLMLTFLSRSAREMARGEVFTKQKQQQIRTGYNGLKIHKSTI